MDEKTLLKHVGNMQQVASVRQVVYTEGRAGGMKAYEVKNGLMRFQVLADKSLDIGDFSYKGINMNFLSKPGLMGRNHFDTSGQEALRSIMGGLFFTCGFENICPPCIDDGVAYPMHGRIRTTPAEHISADAYWKDGKYQIAISGEMREAELFGENMRLRRTIGCAYGEKTIQIKDEIKNCAFRTEPLMLLYHFNMGYPLLEEGARLILPSVKTTPRDNHSRTESCLSMDAPLDQAVEQVFTHELKADANGDTFAALVNDRLQLGLRLTFNQKYLPKFMEWKSIASGDYVVGLEPANASVLGRLHQKEEGLHMLEPLETEEIVLEITILDGIDDIAEIDNHAAQLIKA